MSWESASIAIGDDGARAELPLAGGPNSVNNGFGGAVILSPLPASA